MATIALVGIAAPMPVWADSTPECNGFTEPGPDGVYGTADDIVTSGSTECGAFSYAPGVNSTALGTSAQALARNSTAIGENSIAEAENSVALGRGSRADEANTVSVGTIVAQRRITNVAAGTRGTDAVNLQQMINGDVLAQLNAEEHAKDYTDARETAIRSDMAAGDAATLTSANSYTDTREAAIRGDIAAGNATTLAEAKTYTDARETLIRNAMTVEDDRIEGLANAAQQTADTAITLSDALGTSTAAALGGGSGYNPATGAVSAPNYSIGGQSYNNAGAAFGAVDARPGQLDTRIDALTATNVRRFRQADGGIAAAMALGGTLMPPDANFALSFNLATYRGQQGFSGSAVARLSERVWVSGGFAGSTVKGSTGGRVGMTFGW